MDDVRRYVAEIERLAEDAGQTIGGHSDELRPLMDRAEAALSEDDLKMQRNALRVKAEDYREAAWQAEVVERCFRHSPSVRLLISLLSRSSGLLDQI